MTTDPTNSVVHDLLQRSSAAIMGILNVTPDSFSDGGQFGSKESALRHTFKLVEDGADIIDIGGESTRPGAVPVSLQQELDRVIPVIESIRAETDTPISIDTHKPEVMRLAVAAGANMINDVNALQTDGALRVAAAAQVPVCLMHKKGQPADMQQAPCYGDVIDEVRQFFAARLSACETAGISRSDIVLDPGIGFGKTLKHNLALLQAVPMFRDTMGCNILIGVSRKSLIGDLLSRPVEQRLAASIGLAVQAALNGAKILRVHDVRPTFDAIRSVEAVLGAQSSNQ